MVAVATAAAPTPATTSQTAPSRIYYAHALLWGALPAGRGSTGSLTPDGSRWPRELDRIADLGFSDLLISPPFQAGASGDVFAPADPTRLHPALGGGPSLPALEALANACHARGLGLSIDLPIARAAGDSLIAREHPECCSPVARLSGIDPRLPPADHDAVALRWQDRQAASALLTWSQKWITSLIEAGIDGFRCIGAEIVPAHCWRQLIQSLRRVRPGVRFLAWTPGLSPEQITDLAEVGFDAGFSSMPWWDFREAWLVEEFGRIASIGDVIAMPEAPFGPRVDPAAWTRSLWTAAALGDGILIPMGFEYRTDVSLDAGKSAPQAPHDHTHSASASQPDAFADEIRRANHWIAQHAKDYRHAEMPSLTSPDATVTALARVPRSNVAPPLVVVINPDTLHPASITAGRLASALPQSASMLREIEPSGDGAHDRSAERFVEPPGDDAAAVQACTLELDAGGVRVWQAFADPPIITSPPAGSERERAMLAQAIAAPRIAIEAMAPSLDGGRFAIRRVVGEVVEVSANVWMDGHDQLAVALVWRAVDSPSWHEVPMRAMGNDRWLGRFMPGRIGRYEFTVVAWLDHFGSWVDEVSKKVAAGVDVTVELEQGQKLLREAARHDDTGELPRLEERLRHAEQSERLRALLATDLRQAIELVERLRGEQRAFHVRHSPAQPVEVERTAAAFASWYELFPRSLGVREGRHGRFDDVIERLPAIRAMGFDVLYFPPIHPIGTAHRKGPNNSLIAAPGDPGSPYAIGSEDGGHDALHPELGSFADFRRMIDAARDHGLEIALDFAIQCSPDHPWLREHREWFVIRADGTVRYAENPPKKYEDIVNVDFYTDRPDPAAAGTNAPSAAPALWRALRDVVLFWVEQGVRIFRVDNPHTKPLPFWEWMIGDVRGRHPDTLFLAEAFTRPAMMARLGKVGFNQSYTYFTWRNTKAELAEYMTELTTAPLSEFYRPHFFVNTPDINPHYLQTSGRPGFLIRAALATTLSGLWGVYSGFEVCEGRPHVVKGIAKEEYADAEKYQFRDWDWNTPGNIVAEITRLNAIRRANPALHSHLGLQLCTANDDNILFYARFNPPEIGSDPARRFGDNVLLVAVNVDPHQRHAATIELPLWELGLPDHASVTIEDLVNGNRFTWHGKYQYIDLDPQDQPYRIWRIRSHSGEH